MEKKCKYCAMMIPQEAKICPHCRKKQGTSFAVGCLVVVFLLIIWGIIVNALQESSAPNKQAGSSVSVGEEGRINSGGQETPVAVTEAAFDAWTKASVAKDQHGMAGLLITGSIFGVPQGTKVLVIDRAMFKRKVRVLEGSQKGKAGWIAEEFVKK